MHVAAVLKRKGSRIVSARPTDTVAAVAALLTEHRIGAVLVMEDDAPLGILSERDIVRAIARQGAAALSLSASDVMTRDLITAGPEDTVAGMMTVMTERRIRHVPILENGRVTGVISIGDVVKARIDDAELEVESLRGFVAGIG